MKRLIHRALEALSFRRCGGCDEGTKPHDTHFTVVGRLRYLGRL